MVADSPFLPARGGGEREHLGFVRAAYEAGLLSAVVIPSAQPVGLGPYRLEIGDTPLILTRRRTSPVRLLDPRYPYVVASRPSPPGLGARVRAVTSGVTGVVTFSYKSRLIGAAIAADLRVPMVLRQHNLEGVYHRSLAAQLRGPRRLVMLWEAARIGRDESRVDRDASIAAIADISAADAVTRRAAGGHNVIYVPPFAYDASTAQRPRRPSIADEHKVLFLGALDVETNTAALQWFLTQVWPLVLQQAPSAELDVVGRAPSAGLRALLAAAPRVSLFADVPLVRDYLDSATLAVNPAVTGSGVNIKVIDYLQAGLAVVSTSRATAGLSLRAGQDLEVADTPEAFAASVVLLLHDPLRRDRIASSGRARIETILEPRQNLARIEATFGGAG